MKHKFVIIICAFLAAFFAAYVFFVKGGDEPLTNQVTAAAPDVDKALGGKDEDGLLINDKGAELVSTQGDHKLDSRGGATRGSKQGDRGTRGQGGDSFSKDKRESMGRSEGGSSTLLVYITGAVASPGLYELQLRSTVGDVVKAAGGLLRFADTESINLAQGVESGTHVHIPFTFTGTPEELLRVQRLNVNTATEEELTSIRGIGPMAAKKILDYRKEKGNFQSVDDLTKVKGIGPALLKKIRPFITT